MAEQEESKPDYLSPEWHDYVMTFFAPHELVDDGDKKCPTTAGLRRVAELLLGPIVDSRPEYISPVKEESLGRATVSYVVKFGSFLDGPARVFGDVADVWNGNTDDLFAVHAPATAATRAEGRALRKALKLRGIAAEEICRKLRGSVSDNGGNASICTSEVMATQEQINFLNTKCKKLDMNVMAYVNSGSGKYKSISEVTRDTCIKMIQDLNKISSKGEVPDSLKGFIEDWMKK